MAFYHFQVLHGKDFAIQSALSLTRSPLQETHQGKKRYFLKPDVLDTINKYVLRKHCHCGNTLSYQNIRSPPSAFTTK